MSKPAPSDFELQVLGVLWERGPMTARAVMEALPDQKPRAYTSVLSVMQVMEKKGFLSHTTEGKAHVYRARLNKGRVLGDVMGKLVNLVFGGKRASVVQALLEEKVSAEDLAEMKRLIDEQGKR